MKPIIDDDAERFGMCAGSIAESFTSFIDASGNRTLKDRDTEVFCDYILDDKATLQSTGDKHGLTRERVRQIILRMRRRLKGCYRKAEYEKYRAEVNAVLKDIPEADITDLVAFGFLTQYSRRFTEFVLQCVYDDNAADETVSAAENILSIKRPPKDKPDKVAELLQKAVFPCEDDTAVDFGGIGCVSERQSFAYRDRLLQKFSQSPAVKEVKADPDLEFFSSKTSAHIPDFCLLTEDGKAVLVLVLPTLNMALQYNLRRIEALRGYCKEHGFGYLVTDDRFHTYSDLLAVSVDERLSAELFTVLNKTGSIIWTDILRIKSSFELSGDTLPAFIIQNGLVFTLDPYKIKYAPNAPRKYVTEEEQPPVSPLYEHLRQLRTSIAKEQGVPSFYIFSNKVLDRIATYKPADKEEWLKINGLGEGNYEKYGQIFIQAIKDFKA